MARTTLLPTRQRAQIRAFIVTPVHDVLLRNLNTLHLATAEQLTRLNYRRGMLTTVKTRLKDLAGSWLLPWRFPNPRSGAAPLRVYT